MRLIVFIRLNIDYSEAILKWRDFGHGGLSNRKSRTQKETKV